MNIIDFFRNIFTRKEREIKRTCDNCEHQHSDDCPNSSLCYSLDNKPYFKERVKL